MISRVSAATIAVGVIAAGLTVSVWRLPFVDFAYRSTNAHASLETAAALVSALAAYLTYGRLRGRAQLRDLALVAAFAMLSLTTLVFGALPAAFPSLHWTRLGTWMPVVGRVAASAAFVVAAFAPARRVRRPERAVTVVVAVAAFALVVGSIVVHVIAPGASIPIHTDHPPPPETLGFHQLIHPSLLQCAQFARFLLYLVAAAGFVRRARQGDLFAPWLASGLVLAAFSAVNYYVYPSIYTDWIAMGDIFRLGSYVLLLTAAAAELRRQQVAAAEGARLSERRRVARDVHDAIAQDVAFVVAQTAERDAPLEGEELERVAAAAERALRATRTAMDVLARPPSVPLEVELAATVDAVASRTGVNVNMQVEPGLHIEPEMREAVVRIVGEAVSNAARHGAANVVDVDVWGGAELHVRVVDDGTGFTGAAHSRGTGRGLAGMAERARSLGGRLRIHTSPHGGTAVEAVFP
jgi:signal transduction histidine kinase